MTDKRRARGEGTLEQRGSKTWRLRVFRGTDPNTGHPSQISRTVHVGSKTEALRELRRFTREIDENPLNPAPGTVAHLMVEWLAHIGRLGLARTTLTTYESLSRVRIVPELGSIRLRDLDSKMLDDYYRRLLDEGLSPARVRAIHYCLQGALSQALKWKWIGHNEAQLATPPAPTAPSGRTLAPEQIHALVQAAEHDDPDLALAVLLACLLGLRRGELCGLRWSDVDWPKATIRIERNLVPIKGGYTLGPPKRQGTRTIAIGTGGLALLERYRDLVTERCERLAIEPDWTGWLLSRDGGHSSLSPNGLTWAVSDLGRRIGVPLHLHELRHYSGTHLVAAGVDPRTAAERMGHSPEILLRVYAHALPQRDREAAALLEAGVLVAVDEARNVAGAVVPG